MEIFLSIVGETLIPDDISDILGDFPHESGRKGDPIYATLPKGKTVSRPATSGYWQRSIETGNALVSDDDLNDLFGGLNRDSLIWDTITIDYKCGITVHEAGPNTDPKTIFSDYWLTLFNDIGLELHINED